jgi:hypothetical protein
MDEKHNFSRILRDKLLDLIFIFILCARFIYINIIIVKGNSEATQVSAKNFTPSFTEFQAKPS